MAAAREMKENEQLSTRKVLHEKGGIPTSVIQTLCRAPDGVSNCTTDQTPTGMLTGQAHDAEGGRQTPTSMHSWSTEETIKYLGDCPIVKEEVEEPTAQLWESQWQEFLSTVEVSPSVLGVSRFPQEPAPWDDTPAFLASFEQVARAYQWPKEEWAARLLPTLKGEAELAFSSLEDEDREDYGKVKAAILRGDALNQEKNRQCFRRFCYEEAKGPREAYNQLQELCRRWLKAEKNSKEQILELLILEQFLTVLPPEIQSWIKKHNLESSTQAVSLAEDFVLKWRLVVKEEQMTESQAEESVNLSEVEGTLSDAGQRSPPSWECETEEDTDFSDTDWSDGGNVHENKEKSSQEGMPPEISNDSNPQFGNQEGTPKSWKRKENQQEIYSRKDGHRAIICKEASMKANQTLDSQEIYNRQSCCSACGKTFTHNVSLSLHKKNHQKEKLNMCSQCQKDSSHRKCQKSNSAAKPHKCFDCEKDFHDKTDLIRHQKIHTGEKPYTCSDCGEGFPTRTLLREHQKHHVEKKSSVPPPEVTIYICSECGESFNSALDLDAHQKIHSGQSGRGKKLCQELDLRKFQETHTAERPFKCSDCGASFTWSSSYTRHRKIHSGNMAAKAPFLCINTQKEKKKHSCLKCGKAFPSLWKLRNHEHLHSGEKPYECTDCGERFMLSLSLDEHIKKTHNGKIQVSLLQNMSGTEEEIHICSECGESFDCLSDLSQHERVHTGERPYECINSGGSCTSSLSLERHRKNHEKNKQGYLLKGTSDVSVKYHVCSVCGRRFDRASRLTRHQCIHTGKKSYQCKDCGAYFMWSISLDVHRKKFHNGKKLVLPLSEASNKKSKSLMCSKCGRSFGQATNLSQHQRIHTGEKPYQCTICGESFMWSASLSGHQNKFHNGEKLVPPLSEVSNNKSFTCSKCGKGFSKPSHLARHQCIHTEKKPYQCTDCGEKFMCSTSLDVHKKEIHKGKKLVPVLQRITGVLELEKKISQAAHIIRHPERDTEEKSYKHADLGESFTSGLSLAEDDERKKSDSFLKRISTVQKEAHKCSKCEKSFEWASQLSRHQRVHTGEKPHQCSDCGESFRWHSTLDSHRKKIHDGKKSIICSECGKGFDYMSRLIKHQRSHNTKKPYKCLDCGKKFRFSASFENHRRDHKTDKAEDLAKKLCKTQGKKYMCSECGRSYDQASSLKIHQRVHSGAKPYQCSECGERFMWNSAYYRHKVKIHNIKKAAPLLQRMSNDGEEPHKNFRYGKSIDRQSDLLQHQGPQSGEESCMRSECGETFTEGSHLQKHQNIQVKEKLCKYKYLEHEENFILKDSPEGGESPHSGLQQFSVQIPEDESLQLTSHQDECKLNSVKDGDPQES